MIHGSEPSLIRITIIASTSFRQHILLNHIQESTSACKTYICMPTRIRHRWCHKTSKKHYYKFYMTQAVRKLNLGRTDFRKYWRLIEPSIPDEELLRLFEKAFGAQCLASKVDFVKEVVRRYKAMGAPVCLSGMPIFCLSVFLSTL